MTIPQRNPPDAAVITRPEDAISAAREIAELAQVDALRRDQERIYPLELLDLFTRRGLGSISIPTRFGGGGLSFKIVSDVFRIISAADPALGQIPQNHFGLIQYILGEGNNAQQNRLFNAIVRGQRLGNGGPEKNTRHTRDVQTRLQQHHDGPYISGEKFYSTGALFADIIATTVLDATERPVMVFVPRDSAGLEIIDDWSGMGQRTTASGTVRFTHVAVDPALVIPTPPADRPTLRGAVSQLIQAAIDAGIAEGAFNDARDFIHSGSRPWVDALDQGITRNSDDPYILADVGRLSTELSAALGLLERAAQVLDKASHQPLTEQSTAQASIAVAQAKVLTTEVALKASEKLLEWGGSRATLLKHGLDRHWRNARTHTLHDPQRWKQYAIGNYYLNGVFPPRHAWI